MARTRKVPHTPDATTDRAVRRVQEMLSSIQQSLIMDGALVELKSVGHNGPIQIGHGLGRKPRGVLVVSADAGNYVANIMHATRSTLKVSLTPEWELIERLDIVSTVDEVDFEYSLNGDRDAEYRIKGYWYEVGASTNVLRLRVNGVDSSSLSNEGYARNTSAGTGTSAALAVARSSAAVGDSEVSFESEIIAGTDEHKFAYSRYSMTDGTGSANTEVGQLGSKWEDTSTRITSLGLTGSTANTVGAGSWFELYRRPPAKGRNINLWIF